MKNWVNVGKQHHAEFRRIFNQSMVKYMHPIFGFNVILFDDWLKTPDGTSTADFLKEKYGQRAHDLIFSLIGE